MSNIYLLDCILGRNRLCPLLFRRTFNRFEQCFSLSTSSDFCSERPLCAPVHYQNSNRTSITTTTSTSSPLNIEAPRSNHSSQCCCHYESCYRLSHSYAFTAALVHPRPGRPLSVSSLKPVFVFHLFKEEEEVFIWTTSHSDRDTVAVVVDVASITLLLLMTPLFPSSPVLRF